MNAVERIKNETPEERAARKERLRKISVKYPEAYRLALTREGRRELGEMMEKEDREALG
jgi:hypothetical protein